MQSPGLRRRGWGPRPPAPCSQPFPQNQAELLVRCFLLFFFFPFFLLISRPPLPHAHTRTRRERRGGRDLKPNIQLTVRRGCCLEKKVQLCGLSGLQQRPPALTETSGLRAPPGHRGCGRRATGREPSSLALRPRGMQTPSHPLLSFPFPSFPFPSSPIPFHGSGALGTGARRALAAGFLPPRGGRQRRGRGILGGPRQRPLRWVFVRGVLVHGCRGEVGAFRVYNRLRLVMVRWSSSSAPGCRGLLTGALLSH